MEELFQRPISDMDMAQLLRQLNLINPTPQVFGTRLGDIFAGTKMYDPTTLNPFFALPTDLGVLEVEEKTKDKTKSAKLKRTDQVGEGRLTTEAIKGIGNPEQLVRALYQQPMAGGELSAQATYGRNVYNQPTQMLELQYLREILKNLGFGAYGQATPQGTSAGLRIQGRF